MTDSIGAADLRATRFRAEVIRALEHARGTYIYDACMRDLDEKTAPGDPCGYRAWLSGLLEYLRGTFELDRLRVLDLGCGHGEFTVLMNLMGYEATGIDVNDECLRLARLLAEENGISPERFVKGEEGKLPFAEGSFDVVTMISSLEHIPDGTLAWLVPELHRVCRGVVFVQVPSAMKVSDDHTGLKFVPWLPRPLAAAYVALRGPRYRYLISESGGWDVVYRNLDAIKAWFSTGFSMEVVPPAHSYPPIHEKDAILDLKKQVRLGRFSTTLRVPLVFRRLQRIAGKQIEHFYPYYNVAFKRC